MKLTYKRVANTLLASLFGLVLLPAAAQASCYINGPVVRVTQYDDSYSSYGCYIYMRSTATSSYYYYARSNDDNVCNTAATAATSGVDVGISGNASACPTTGTGRSMGVTNYIIINP